jgi:hypothetical protein
MPVVKQRRNGCGCDPASLFVSRVGANIVGVRHRYALLALIAAIARAIAARASRIWSAAEF